MAAGDEDFGSLFEGMVVLVDPSQPSTSADEDQPPPPIVTAADPPRDSPPPPLASQSQPLDENLFSDLIITTPEQPLPAPSPSFTPAAVSSSRTITRKKKRGGVRIGYARSSSSQFPFQLEVGDLAPDGGFRDGEEDGGSSAMDGPKKELGSPSPSPSRSRTLEREDSAENGDPVLPLYAASDGRHQPDADEASMASKDLEVESHLQIADAGETVDGTTQFPVLGSQMVSVEVKIDEKSIEASNHANQSCEKEEPKKLPVSVEEKLALILGSISKKREKILETAASVSASRKEAVRRRRNFADNVNSAAAKYKELERELEEACEAEDFERAERVSERLLEVEQGKQEFLNAQRHAEAECDSIDLEMQQVLEMQIAAEGESASILETLAKDAADSAEMVSRNTKEFSSKENEEWITSTEALESRKMELDIESYFVRDAEGRLKESIEASISDDRAEKEILTKRRQMLTEELEKLLVLVGLKEAEIAENDCKSQEVDKRIANAVSGCQEAQSIIDKNNEYLQSELSRIELENEALLLKKKKADDFFSVEEKKKLKFEELATTAAVEAKAFIEFVELRKSLAASILKTREEKLWLAESVEKMTDEVQIIKQNVSAARTSLQELSLNRASIQQKIASAKQRIDFIDKRRPEVEIEKKVASAARNFKEAARIASEAKALSIEKESIQNKLQTDTLELEKVENVIEHTVNQIQKDEELISSKEKEAALSRLQMLQLLATTARAEESAALELDDVEEAAMLHAEAEALESEAAKLQEAYGFEDLSEAAGKPLRHVPIALLVNLAGEKLIEMAGSVNFIR